MAASRKHVQIYYVLQGSSPVADNRTLVGHNRISWRLVGVLALFFFIASVLLGAVLGWAFGRERSRADDADQSTLRMTAREATLTNNVAVLTGNVTALTDHVATLSARVAERRAVCSDAEPERAVSVLLQRAEKTARIFDPPTAAELRQARDALFADTSLDLERNASTTTIASNYISMMDLMPVDKSAALGYIDQGGAFPGRYIRVTIHFGARNPPVSLEFKVGPVGAGSAPTITQITQPTLPFSMRAPDIYEYNAINEVIAAGLSQIRDILIESYGGYHGDPDCTRCLTWSDTAPRGNSRTARMTWFWFLAATDGYYANPVGLEFLVDHAGTDTSTFSIKEIVYNSQSFTSIQQFKDAYNTKPGFRKIRIDPSEWEDAADGTPNYASMRRRGPVRDLEDRVPPQIVMPEGRRFAVKGRAVYWMDWLFHIGYTTHSGLMFRDLRFRNQRIVYEMGLQEAFAGYSDEANPSQMNSYYLDSSWGMSRAMYELVEGVDCPFGAVFLNTTYFMAGSFLATGEPMLLPRSVCIFEESVQTSVTRHFDNAFDGGYNFMGATPLTRLVVRTASTVYNYDYNYDTVFYPDGSVENRATAGGYLQSTFYDPNANSHHVGTRVANHTLGSLHDHFWNYKVDFDIHGTSNTLVRHDYVVRDFTPPFKVYPTGIMKQKAVEHTTVLQESKGDSSMVYNPRGGTVFSIGNPAVQNKWGKTRSYKIQFLQTAAEILDDGATYFMPGAQWLKYSAVVTARKDAINEQRVGYSYFDQEPVQEFDSWAFDGDRLERTDLVAWVTVGAMHMPHAEDIPVTYSIGTTSSFLIKPMNYFDESPLMDLTANIYVKADGSFTESNINVPSGQECFPAAKPFQFAGAQYVAPETSQA